MRRHRRAYDYKFTEKTHSKRGIVALALAVLSTGLAAAMFGISYSQKGNGTVYLGSVGILALLIALVAFVLAVLSMREENSYRIFPVTATAWGGIILAGWILIYISGIF